MKVHVAGIRLFVAVLSLSAAACGASEGPGGRELSLKVTDKTTARAVGLPAYPGSKLYKDHGEDPSGADIGISTPLFGLNVVALKMESSDEPESVAAFYHKALSKYGDVLECSDASDRKRTREPSADTDGLTCDADEPGPHAVVYKVGTENNQRIVAIDSYGSGTRFSLVHVDIRDNSEQ
jgi:hypothetical protein